MGKKEAELEKKLSPIEGKVLVAGHAFPDPDTIGGERGIAYIVKEKFNLESDIAHAGNPDHLSLGMEKKLEEYFSPAKNISEIALDDYAAIILVDTNLDSETQPFADSQLKNLDRGKVIVIDHHDKGKDNGYLFEDITENGICSTCTRIMEYLKAFKICLDKDNPEHQLLATSLVVGQKIDARSRPMTSRDATALAHILDVRNSNLEREMEISLVTPEGNRFIGRAEKEFIISGVYAIAYGGELSNNDRIAKAIAADGLLRIQSVEVSVVWGWFYSNGIYSPDGSIRTKERSGHIAKRIAKEKFNGNGSTYSAGYTFDVGHFGPLTKTSKDEFTDKIQKATIERVTGKKEEDE